MAQAEGREREDRRQSKGRWGNTMREVPHRSHELAQRQAAKLRHTTGRIKK